MQSKKNAAYDKSCCRELDYSDEYREDDYPVIIGETLGIDSIYQYCTKSGVQIRE